MEIHLEAKFDIDSGIMQVKPIESEWMDLGYFLEVVSYLAKLNLGHDDRVKTPEDMAEYIKQYVLKGLADYKDLTTKNIV